MNVEKGLGSAFIAAAVGCLAVHAGSAFLAATVLPFDPLITASNGVKDVMIQAMA